MSSERGFRLGVESGLGDADGGESLAATGTELAVGAGSGRAGLQPTTAYETVPSRKVLRLTSNPIPRVLVLDRQSGCRWPQRVTVSRLRLNPNVRASSPAHLADLPQRARLMFYEREPDGPSS